MTNRRPVTTNGMGHGHFCKQKQLCDYDCLLLLGTYIQRCSSSRNKFTWYFNVRTHILLMLKYSSVRQYQWCISAKGFHNVQSSFDLQKSIADTWGCWWAPAFNVLTLEVPWVYIFMDIFDDKMSFNRSQWLFC